MFCILVNAGASGPVAIAGTLVLGSHYGRTDQVFPEAHEGSVLKVSELVKGAGVVVTVQVINGRSWGFLLMNCFRFKNWVIVVVDESNGRMFFRRVEYF